MAETDPAITNATDMPAPLSNKAVGSAYATVSRALKAAQKRALGRATAPAVDGAIWHVL